MTLKLSKPSRNHGFKPRRDRRSAAARESQLVWTFFVGLAVAIFALIQSQGPKSSYIVHSAPEGLSSAHPILKPADDSLHIEPIQQAGADGAHSGPRAPASK